MRSKLLIVLTVLGLAAAGFSAFGLNGARAGLPHIVDGDVGPSVAPGPGNPSNLASAVYYLTNKPAEPVQIELDITDADGTFPAYYGVEVGSGWGWAADDEVVVVVETLRNINGWTGSNYTTSSDGLLTSANVDSLPTATIQALPTLALVKGPTYVNVTWTGLTDGNGNMVDYEVRRAPNLASAFTQIDTSSPHVSTGSVWYNDTGRPQGTWCYKIAANYRRDTAGGTYTTIGTSEPACVTIGAAPYLVSTTPSNGQMGVGVGADIVITFSEPMNPSTVTLTFSDPGITFVRNWDATFIALTLTHGTPFTDCTAYTMLVAGRDADDNFPLDPAQGVPNPWSFTTACVNPFIQLTVPASGASGVGLNAPVQVTFSEPMDTLTVTASFSPTIANQSSWDPTNTVLTLDHTTPFAAGTTYTVTIAGDDPDGNPLVAGPVPNPWSFTTNNLPVVDLTTPSPGACWTGGTVHDLAWTMIDTETATGSLIVWLNYSYQGGAAGGAIAGPLTGRTSPDTYAWNVPSINALDVVVTIEVVDETGDGASDASGLFEVDSIVPSVVSISPGSGAASVALADDIVITFSEGMDRPSTQGAITITPALSGIGYTWSTGSDVLTISHDNFAPITQYTVAISTSARDDCSPGLGLSPAFSSSFTSAGIPTPNPPTNLRTTDQTTTTIALAWDAPTLNTDGTTLAAGEIQGYYVYRSTNPSAARADRTNLTSGGPVSGLAFTDQGLTAGTTYYYWVATVHANGRVSGDSNRATGTTTALPQDLSWLLWLLLIIIIIVVLVIVAYAWKRKKKPEEAPPPEEIPEEPAAPVEEAVAPAEEPEAPPKEPSPWEEPTRPEGGPGTGGGSA